MVKKIGNLLVKISTKFWFIFMRVGTLILGVELILLICLDLWDLEEGNSVYIRHGFLNVCVTYVYEVKICSK